MIALLLGSAVTLLAAFAADEALIGSGSWRPLHAAANEIEQPVEAFVLQKYPVTNAAYLEFVKAQPKWQREKVAKLFTDIGYLRHWAGPLELGEAVLPNQPVVHVSWFAAKAYCEHNGMRLPYEGEWELAAMADDSRADAQDDPEFSARILKWYARPGSRALPEVGQSVANVWGVHDLHGVVWEWVLDFNSGMVGSDGRDPGDKTRQSFCGAAGEAPGAKQDYAKFMRFAFRGALEARFTGSSLGFRCARNAKTSQNLKP